jgi:hypothetical protein
LQGKLIVVQLLIFHTFHGNGRFITAFTRACHCSLFRTLNQILKITGGWRKLHNEELHNLYSSPNIIIMIKSRRMGWAGHATRMNAKSNAYRMLVGKPEGKRPLVRRSRWVDNIKMDAREMGWCGMDWIDLAEDRDHWRALVNMVMNLWVP